MMPTTGMTRAFGGIVSDRTIDTRVRRALDRFGQPYLWVTNEGVYLDDQGRIALRLASASLSQSSAGLAIAQDIRTTASPAFAGLTLTNFNGFLYATNGVVSVATNLCTLLTSSFTQAGNTAGVETTLFTYTVPGGTLSSDGACLEFMASGTISNSANTDKRIRVKFGASTILDTTGCGGGFLFDWTLRGTVIRTGATSQKAEASLSYQLNGDAPLQVQNYHVPAETMANDIALTITGQGTSANDVLGEFWKVVKQST